MTVLPGRVEVDYELSISELTLTRELRSLVGPLDLADRQALFNRYAAETGPMNAKGLLVKINDQPLELRFQSFRLVVEDHPRFFFRMVGTAPGSGSISVRDTNFASSEGTSRLAIRGADGVDLRADDQPGNVEELPIREIWQLDDDEELRTKYVVATYHTATTNGSTSATSQSARVEPPGQSKITLDGASRKRNLKKGRAPSSSLTWLLDANPYLSIPALAATAFLIGVFHSIQPGHGKSLLAAATVGRTDRGFALLLAFTATLTHFGSVLLIAAALRLTHFSQYEFVNQSLVRIAGLTIATIGVWRLGRCLGGCKTRHDPSQHESGSGNWFALGVAAGIVPCWEAIVLILMAEAVGRLALGVVLILAFSLGMLAVLILVGYGARWLRSLSQRFDAKRTWAFRLDLASSTVLAVLGSGLLFR